MNTNETKTALRVESNSPTRVAVTIVLDIDAEAWALEYGIDLSDVERDVENHACNTVIEQFRTLGLLA